MTVLSEVSLPETDQSTTSSTNVTDIQEYKRMARLEIFRNDPEYKNFCSWVMSEFHKAESARQRTQRQWSLNYAFYRGNQDLRLAPLDNRLGPMAGRIAKSDTRNVKAINRIRPMVRVELAKWCSQKPSAVVIPASSEDEDLFAAYAAEQVYESMYTRLKIQSIFRRAAFWMSVTGVGFLKTWWDAGKIDIDSNIEGDVGLTSPTPYNIFVPDLMEPEIEEQPWVIHAYAKPVGWVKNAYKAELIGHEIQADALGDPELKNAIEGTTRVTSGASESKPDSVMLYEMWMKPGAHELFPNGGMVTIAGGIVVEVNTEGIPYRHGQYPFIKFDHVPTDTFYADSVITDLISLQIDYNNIRNKIKDSIKKMGSMQLIAPKGSITPSQVTNQTGQVILYNPGIGKPEPFPLQQLPQHYMSELERILMDIEDISGQHQVSKGTAPPGVTAATAISFLQEQDDNYMVPSYQSIEAGMEKLAKQILMLAVQYWDTPRLVRVAGADNAFDTQLLTGAKIATGTDIRIEGGSALPQSKAARQALIMDLMATGAIEQNEGLKIMEIGGSKRIIDQLQQDESQAKRENIKLKSLTEEDIQMFTQMWEQQAAMGGEAEIDAQTGMPLEPPPMIPVNTWDNHEVHVEIHNRFRKGQSFELLPDSVKAAFETHVEMHKQVMMQEAIQDFLGDIPSDGTDGGVMGPGANPEALINSLGGGDPVKLGQEAPPEGEAPPEDGAPPEQIQGQGELF